MTMKSMKSTSWDPEAQEKEEAAPLSFLPIEIATIVFASYRIVFNILYFIPVAQSMIKGEFDNFLWIGHVIEFFLCIAAWLLHTTRFYKHFGVIWRLSIRHWGWNLLFTLLTSSWIVATSLYFYFGPNLLSDTFGEHYWIYFVIVLTAITSTNQIGSYYIFAAKYFEQGEIDWVRWWIDKPLMTFNLTVQIFLILERDIWVTVWMGDFIYHLSEYVVVFWKKHRENGLDPELGLSKHQKGAQSGMVGAASHSIFTTSPESVQSDAFRYN